MPKKIPKSIKEAHQLFLSREILPTDLVNHYLKIIAEKNPEINAVLEVFEDAKEQSKIADEIFNNPEGNPRGIRALEGIPFLIKDCILVSGQIASSGSQMLKNYVAPYDATIIKIIKDHGGIILGRTNMDEFALGGSGENSSYGKTLNPHDTTRVPGGTSSGSAAALAAGMSLITIGTDTGGSVRQPASFCGVVGFKASYGGISRSGLIAAASSLEGAGIFANNVDDIELIYSLVGKEDVLDNTSIPDSLRKELADKYSDNKNNKKVLYPKEYIESEGINEEVKKNFYQNLDKLKNAGYEVQDINFETLKYALSVYYIINTAEVSTNLSRMDGLRFGGGEVGDIKNYQELFSKNRGKFFGPEVKRRIMLGTYVLSHGYYDAFYGKALLLREKMKLEFEDFFKQGTIIVMPTAPTTAWKIGEMKDPLTLYLEDIFTVPANLVGIPGVSIPSGVDTNKMPFSLQVLANFGDEETLFKFAKDFTTM